MLDRQPWRRKFCIVVLGMSSGVTGMISIDFVETRRAWFVLPALDFLLPPLNIENKIKN